MSAPAGPQGVARNIATWRRYAARRINAEVKRKDVRRNMLAIVDHIAFAWHPTSGTSSPGHAAIIEALGCNKSTVTDNVWRLKDMGLIGVAYEGTVTADGQNLRAEYVPLSRVPERATTATRWDLSKLPETKGERIAAATEMRRRAQEWLSGLSARALASICKRWHEAGWTPKELLTAMDNRPDGPWTFTSTPHHVAGWVRHRLSYWLAPDGEPGVPLSRVEDERRAAARERALAAEEAHQAEVRERQRGLSGGTLRAIANAKNVAAAAAKNVKYRASSEGRKNRTHPTVLLSEESPLTHARGLRSNSGQQAARGPGLDPRLKAVFARHGVNLDEQAGNSATTTPPPTPVPRVFPARTSSLPLISASA